MTRTGNVAIKTITGKSAKIEPSIGSGFILKTIMAFILSSLGA